MGHDVKYIHYMYHITYIVVQPYIIIKTVKRTIILSHLSSTWTALLRFSYQRRHDHIIFEKNIWSFTWRMKVIALDYAKLEENSQIEMIMPSPCFSIQGNIISVLMRVCHAGSRTMTKQDGLIAMTSHDRRGVSNYWNLYFVQHITRDDIK